MKNKYPKSFKGIHCDVVGMGISNIALAEYLYNSGAIITVRDKKIPSPPIQAQLKKFSERQIYGEEYLSELTGEYIFRSPSVRPDIPEISHSVEKGSILGSEWELFFHRAPCNILAVTGSDGKTTTVTLTERILSLSQPQRQLYAAGNIGTPLISLIDKITINDIVIAELSSFQLMSFNGIPLASAVTNISPNHMDYHLSMAEYIEAKINIVSPHSQRVVLHPKHIPEESLKQISLKHNNVIYCGFDDNYPIFCHNNIIYDHFNPIIETRNIKLKGDHNLENYMTAIGICGELANKDAINDVADNFEGVAHRMQLICEKNGIKYYDSSIDSTPSRTAASLQIMTISTTVICGGYDKGLTYELLADALYKKAYAVIVTGAAAPKILDEIYRLPSAPFNCYYVPDFEKAVRKAISVTPRGSAVVLSPACASFDRFKDYKERGRFFQEIVKALPD